MSIKKWLTYADPSPYLAPEEVAGATTDGCINNAVGNQLTLRAVADNGAVLITALDAASRNPLTSLDVAEIESDINDGSAPFGPPNLNWIAWPVQTDDPTDTGAGPWVNDTFSTFNSNNVAYDLTTLIGTPSAGIAGHDDIFADVPLGVAASSSFGIGIFHNGAAFFGGAAAEDASGYPLLIGMPSNDGVDLVDESTYFMQLSQAAIAGAAATPPICGTNPVSLTWVKNRTLGSRYYFEWKTAAESQNLGYHLWVKQDGQWRLLNVNPYMVRISDSNVEQSFRRAYRVNGEVETWGLSQIDLDGTENFYGPFDLDAESGQPTELPKIDWASIREQQDALMAQKGYAKVNGQYLRTSSLTDFTKTGGLLANLRTTTAGMHRVTAAELQAIGVDLSSTNENTLGLYHRGVAVPRYIGKIDGQIAYVDFYADDLTGEDLQNTRENVYQLAAVRRVTKTARQMNRAASSEELAPLYVSETLEDERYSTATYGGTEDLWFMDRFYARNAAEQSRDYTLDLSGVRDAMPGTVTVEGGGIYDYLTDSAEGSMEVIVNGTSVGSAPLDGTSVERKFYPVPAGVIVDGENTVTLKITASDEPEVLIAGISLDSIRIDYATTADVSVESQLYTKFVYERGQRAAHVRFNNVPEDAVAYARMPTGLANTRYRRMPSTLWRIETPRASDGSLSLDLRRATTASLLEYWVSSADDLLKPAVEAVSPVDSVAGDNGNYLVISHDSFIDGLQTYTDWKDGQDYIDSDGNGAQFDTRVVSADAIYDYYGGGIKSARAIQRYINAVNESAGIDHVLLVGNGSIDPSDFSDSGAINFMPTHYEVLERDLVGPVDGWMVDIDQNGVPNIPLGRWAVRSSEDLANVIAKTQTYAEQGRFAAGVLEIADDADSTVYGSGALAVSSQLPTGTVVSRVLSSEGVDAARTAITAGFNANPSVVIASGHGGIDRWGRNALLSAGGVTQMTNTVAPVGLAMTCYTTYFPTTSADALGPLLMNGEHGTVALLGGTVLSGVTEVTDMTGVVAKSFFGGKTLGQALNAGKISRGGDKTSRNFTLLGDPTITIQ
ncbi:C25 family cysteine peptidase [Gammaproteobacteria bacterium]|nr:C25 family cysteine peptidase [Gammaproteobacteria bacterium]